MPSRNTASKFGESWAAGFVWKGQALSSVIVGSVILLLLLRVLIFLAGW